MNPTVEQQKWIERLIHDRLCKEQEIDRLRKSLAAKDAEIARLTALIEDTAKNIDRCVSPESIELTQRQLDRRLQRAIWEKNRFKEAARKLNLHGQPPDFWDSIYEKIGPFPMLTEADAMNEPTGEGDE